MRAHFAQTPPGEHRAVQVNDVVVTDAGELDVEDGALVGSAAKATLFVPIVDDLRGVFPRWSMRLPLGVAEQCRTIRLVWRVDMQRTLPRARVSYPV